MHGDGVVRVWEGCWNSSLIHTYFIIDYLILLPRAFVSYRRIPSFNRTVALCYAVLALFSTQMRYPLVGYSQKPCALPTEAEVRRVDRSFFAIWGPKPIVVAFIRKRGNL